MFSDLNVNLNYDFTEFTVNDLKCWDYDETKKLREY